MKENHGKSSSQKGANLVEGYVSPYPAGYGKTNDVSDQIDLMSCLTWIYTEKHIWQIRWYIWIPTKIIHWCRKKRVWIWIVLFNKFLSQQKMAISTKRGLILLIVHEKRDEKQWRKTCRDEKTRRPQRGRPVMLVPLEYYALPKTNKCARVDQLPLFPYNGG